MSINLTKFKAQIALRLAETSHETLGNLWNILQWQNCIREHKSRRQRRKPFRWHFLCLVENVEPFCHHQVKLSHRVILMHVWRERENVMQSRRGIAEVECHRQSVYIHLRQTQRSSTISQSYFPAQSFCRFLIFLLLVDCASSAFQCYFRHNFNWLNQSDRVPLFC